MERSFRDQMTNVYATYFYDAPDNPVMVKKEFSSFIIVDTIRDFISDQYFYIFGYHPEPTQLNTLVDGFILFHLHKNKYMLKSKDALLKYIEDKSIAHEEIYYFINFYLYNQKPLFLNINELEYIKSCGSLDGFELDD